MDVTEADSRSDAVLDEVARAVVADRNVLRTVMVCLLARGHVLLEDVPGTGKTLTARSFATALGLSFSRVQFTPDLLPADVTGTTVFVRGAGAFEFREGPIFANVVLADEINRASPKTQAALLEAMEEGQVTVAGDSYPLPDPFFVIATQNPVETGEGTFPLPAAQKDRFLVKQSLGYPDESGELELLERREARTGLAPTVEAVTDVEAVRELQSAPESVDVERDLKRYILDIVRATREDSRVSVGVSPRGAQRLFEVVRARAAMAGRSFVKPDDVKALSRPVLAHRIVLTPDATVADIAATDIVDDILEEISVPTVSRATPQ